MISPDEERALAASIAALSFAPYRFRGVEARRRVVGFGRSYDLGKAAPSAGPIPIWLTALRDRVAAWSGLEREALVHVLINEYRPGAGIGWHRDRPTFDQVIGISLLAPAILQFRRRTDRGFDRLGVHLAPRSAYRLDGEARTHWEHSVPVAGALRYSITFRSLRTVEAPT